MFKTLINAFRPAKKKMSDSERTAIEVARVKAVDPDWALLSEEEKRTCAYSVEEKEAMYRARRDLRLLPPTGAHGGMIQAIATSLDGLTRQYIHQTFYPKDPNKLFAGRSVLQKRAWELLVAKVAAHPLLPKYKLVFDTILRGSPVEVTMSVGKFRWVEKKARELVPGLVITSRPTVPTTYTLTPPKTCSQSAPQ